ncbi:peptidase [Spongiactinospora gelatinilytica]|uniref:Peptidase n=1 Tax=Spongiactinospora gelatinilytica TaxID=2666298 RepID=A0A2W2GZS0_9ACTN|nr:S41 family peptidase [Spongiactinospora gelatinilytica]PZG53901.1 peptidase [Spongiactinospora gelatinilytica]
MSGKGVAAGLALLFLLTACTGQTPPRAEAVRATEAGTSACAHPPRGTDPGPQTPVTIDVVEQAYLCILAYHYSGATLDARSLLLAGFAAFTQELNRAGHDLPEATMPALGGDRAADWAAFEAAYRRVTGRLPDDGELREKLAAATLRAVVAALGDNHARWAPGRRPPPGYYDGDQYGLGLRTSLRAQVGENPGVALPPLFVTAVLGGAAEKAGLRPGDVIASIDGSAPFIGGQVTSAAIAALYPQYPQADPVRLQVRREGSSRTVTLKPGLFQPDPDAVRPVTAKVLDDDVAYVRLGGFGPDAADRVLKEIARLRAGRTLTGLVLDLRGNGGGSPNEVNRLLGGFAHGEVTAYLCRVDGTCDTMRTDDTVPLVGLPLVVLIDRGCASACEHFGSVVKDLRLGTLVGTRTAGAMPGPAEPYLLGNNTVLTLPSRRHLAPGREVIDRIGVAPHHHVPPAAKDAAAGRDAALAKALTLLRG